MSINEEPKTKLRPYYRERDYSDVSDREIWKWLNTDDTRFWVASIRNRVLKEAIDNQELRQQVLQNSEMLTLLYDVVQGTVLDLAAAKRAISWLSRLQKKYLPESTLQVVEQIEPAKVPEAAPKVKLWRMDEFEEWGITMSEGQGTRVYVFIPLGATGEDGVEVPRDPKKVDIRLNPKNRLQAVVIGMSKKGESEPSGYIGLPFPDDLAGYFTQDLHKPKNEEKRKIVEAWTRVFGSEFQAQKKVLELKPYREKTIFRDPIPIEKIRVKPVLIVWDARSDVTRGKQVVRISSNQGEFIVDEKAFLYPKLQIPRNLIDWPNVAEGLLHGQGKKGYRLRSNFYELPGYFASDPSQLLTACLHEYDYTNNWRPKIKKARAIRRKSKQIDFSAVEPRLPVTKEKKLPQRSFGLDSSIGIGRDENEDVAIFQENRAGDGDSIRIAIVADGMGGHQDGKKAAEVCVYEVQSYISENSKQILTEKSAARVLYDAIRHARAQLQSLRSQYSERWGELPDSTIIVTMEYKGILKYSWLGDSRLYVINRRTGQIDQITEDHTLVNALLSSGSLTASEAASHPHRNVVIKSVGKGSDTDIQIGSVDVTDPDLAYLLCSDGLTNLLEDKRIARIIQHAKSPEVAAELLRKEALSAASRGTDNITAVVSF